MWTTVVTEGRTYGRRRWATRSVPIYTARGRGSAPGWREPWSRARLAHVERDPNGWRNGLVGDDGTVIDEADLQRAQLSVRLHLWYIQVYSGAEVAYVITNPPAGY